MSSSSRAIAGSIHIPRGHLEAQVESRIADRDRPIVVMCAGGVRSAFAAKTLGELGYTDVVSMDGGFNKWKDEGRAWAKPTSLTAEQRNRYQRHLLLPEVGEEGQLRLLDARVLLLGAGGLGSPAALYLAAAGVGTIGIIDMDVVDASNLQRQILHNVDRIGERKVDSAKKTLEYCSKHFGPYQHRQVRILEFPRYRQFAQSFPNTIPCSESAGFIARVDDAEDIDTVFYITAHEVAHQWWGNILTPGKGPGGNIVSEGLAHYSAALLLVLSICWIV